MRTLVLITLANGALLDVAVASHNGKEAGEQALLRQMFETLICQHRWHRFNTKSYTLVFSVVLLSSFAARKKIMSSF